MSHQYLLLVAVGIDEQQWATKSQNYHRQQVYGAAQAIKGEDHSKLYKCATDREELIVSSLVIPDLSPDEWSEAEEYQTLEEEQEDGYESSESRGEHDCCDKDRIEADGALHDTWVDVKSACGREIVRPQMDEREDHDQSCHCVIRVADGQRLEHRSQKGEDEGQEEEAAKLLRNLTTVHLVTVECPMDRIACHQQSQSAHADDHIRVFPIVQVEERRLKRVQPQM